MLFIDKKEKMVDIELYGENGVEWAAEFFDAGTLCSWGAGKEIVHEVDSVDYLESQLHDLVFHMGDYAEEDLYGIEDEVIRYTIQPYAYVFISGGARDGEFIKVFDTEAEALDFASDNSDIYDDEEALCAVGFDGRFL